MRKTHSLSRTARCADRQRRKASRGVGVVMVLGVLSITLALSYALLRTQAVTAQINSNFHCLAEARQAALAGLADGLRTMHQSDWQGVDASYERRLDDRVGYTVAFHTGDASLLGADGKISSSHPDGQSYPWRVTIEATGFASDPRRSDRIVERKVSAVVQLVPRQRSAPAGDFSATQGFTLYQWSTAQTKVQFPAHVRGPVRLHGGLSLCEEYPRSSVQVARYLDDLRRMAVDYKADGRPFTGPLVINRSLTDTQSLDLLEAKLGVTVDHTATSDPSIGEHPGSVLEYRLYPGGKGYSIPSLTALYGSTLSQTSLAPDPLTNPLGVYRTTSTLTLGDKARITGTLIGGPGVDVRISGASVQLAAPPLPPLRGEAAPPHLPLALVARDLRLLSSSQSLLRGQLISWERFEVPRGSSATTAMVEGQVLAREVTLAGRSNWDMGQLWWDTAWLDFQLQLVLPGAVTHFPIWLQGLYGLNATPKIDLRSDPSGAAYHHQDWTQPLVVPHPNDEGLVWEIVRWSRDEP